jgi:hypothetical protein
VIFRTYTELARLPTFEERFAYLEMGGQVGYETFGHDRHINQTFYRSQEWRSIRDFVISRDWGCDLGVLGYELAEPPLIHHINAMSVDDILHREEWILNPEYLITTCHATHNAIHYGDSSLLPKVVLERKPGDTTLW